ncbi:hypothetical protein L7F22_056606 [Adiantum nelumboides]|nr:hypothetical protein [Adiantum nelumboides]
MCSALYFHVQHGEFLAAFKLFSKMLQARVSVDRVAVLRALKACSHLQSVDQGRLVHGVIIENSLEADRTIGNAIVGLYGKCAALDDAQFSFDKLQRQSVVSWSALIGGYADQGHGVIALEIFQEALQLGLKPNRVTFLSALKACSSIEGFQDGMLIHGQICGAGMESNIMLASSLIDMYAKCGGLEEARAVFVKVCHMSVAPWNAVISGYLQHGDNAMACNMLQKMELQGLNANKVTILCILKACPSLETLVLVRLAHDKIIRMDLISDVAVGNALADMYNKCGSVEEAERAFSMLRVRTVVSWTAVIDGFIRHGQHSSALNYFMKMQEEKILPDEATFSSILGACIMEGYIEQGKFIHDCIVKRKMELNLVIGSALVNMYAKNGLMLEAQSVLNHLPIRSTESWGALITGYSYYGHGHLAIESFLNMQHDGVPSDKAASICTLKACADVGDLDLGKALHHQLTISGFNADAQVGTTLVNFYGKNSCLGDARRVFNCIMTPDVVTWGALIGGYVFCKEFKMAVDCLNEMQEQGLSPPNAIYTSVICCCTYTGEMTKGQRQFNDVEQSIENYTGMVDLLGRSGCLRSAKDVIHTMPMLPDDISWTTLLTSCKVYGDSCRTST